MSSYYWLLLPVIIVGYIIAQILYDIFHKPKRRQQRQLAGECIEDAVKRMAKRQLKPPAIGDPIIEEFEKELNRLKKIE